MHLYDKMVEDNIPIISNPPSAEDELKQQIPLPGPGAGAATTAASAHLPTDNSQSSSEDSHTRGLVHVYKVYKKFNRVI